jgi:hypothetical protein
MQHFGQRRAHPSAFAGGEHNDFEFHEKNTTAIRSAGVNIDGRD